MVHICRDEYREGSQRGTRRCNLKVKARRMHREPRRKRGIEEKNEKHSVKAETHSQFLDIKREKENRRKRQELRKRT